MNHLKTIYDKWKSGEIAKPQYIETMRGTHGLLFDYADWLQGNEVKKIEISENGIVMTMGEEEIRMICSPECGRVAPFEALNFGSYEPHEKEKMISLLQSKRRDPVIFDVGANIGYHSIFFKKRIPGAKIYAFEPIPKNFSYLRQHFDLNNIKDVEPINVGLSNYKGDVVFYFDPNCSVNASARNVAGKIDIQEIKCQVVPLDQVALERNLNVDFIKVDVEGAELMVLEGAIETLKKDRPIVFVEMLRKWTAAYDYHPNQIIEFMAKLGYRCFLLNKGHLEAFEKMTDDTVDTNFFFLHSSTV